ncbi:MAG TPA: inositol monophosphatase [Caldilineae bacterium]|nr:inositol monophosphatase [Caldilineae bacterium]
MLDTAIRLAREAGQLAFESISLSPHVSEKGRRDLITDVDLAAQRIIVEGLRSSFPDHAILAEEGAFDRDGPAEWMWVIDPLDGTTNYARGLPSFCVSIALQHRGESYLGVIYDPVRDHLFYAQRGEGAWLNGHRLQVSQRDGLAGTLVGYDWPRTDEGRRVLVAMIDRLSQEAIAIRSFGAAALGLCYVAAGWYDIYMNPELRVWDIAAGMLLVEEAGGVVSVSEEPTVGRHARACLASNGRVHDLLREVYRRARGSVCQGGDVA